MRAGLITGTYCDAVACHGFLRDRDGTITTFYAPGAGTSGFAGTFPFSINPAGTITGRYYDASFASHGFVRARDGAIITFDAPGAVSGVEFQGTSPFGVNPAGEITGYYQDMNLATHGFVRARDGTITTFDVPGAATGPGTSPLASTRLE